MKKKRYLWIWLADGASEIEQTCWRRFIKVTMTVSADTRFLTLQSEDELQRKCAILERAGWQIGRWGEGWMQRVIYLTKDVD